MFEGETYCVESLAQAKEPPGVVEVAWSRGGSKKILLKVQRSDIINTQIHKSKISLLFLFTTFLDVHVPKPTRLRDAGYGAVKRY